MPAPRAPSSRPLRGLLTLTWLICTLCAPPQAQADTLELSVRPAAELRYGAAHTQGASGQPYGWGWGAGAQLSLGLTFSLSVSAQYLYGQSLEFLQRLPNGAQDRWRERRHVGLVGLQWAPSDEWTPILGVELGLGGAQPFGVQRLDQRGHVDPLASTQVRPLWRDELFWLARLSAGFEWRFLDALSLSPSLAVEYAQRFGVAAQLWLGFYRYL